MSSRRSRPPRKTMDIPPLPRVEEPRWGRILAALRTAGYPSARVARHIDMPRELASDLIAAELAGLPFPRVRPISWATGQALLNLYTFAVRSGQCPDANLLPSSPLRSLP